MARAVDLLMADRAVKIVDFKSNKRAVLNEREIQRIIKQEDLPTVVVSIGGVARSGKSFLLNLLVNYLTYLEKHGSASGWETSGHPVQGVNWAQSRKLVTLGIWMWSKPFVIRRLDGKRVAVLLVDCQGTGDNQRSDPMLDTLIMYISLMLSSFQLININSYLRAEELTSLQLCVNYADIVEVEGSPTRGQSTHSHLFDSLIFVVRNYQTDDILGEQPTLFQEIKYYYLTEDSNNAELSRAVEGIEKAFNHITAFAFPYPGHEIAGANEKQKTWTLQDIPKRFLDPVKELATVLFTSDRMATEELPTGSQILEKFKVLKMYLESTDLPGIRNPADALQEAILDKAFSKANTLYAETLREVQRNLLSHKSEADLRKTLASARYLALQVFYSEGRQHKYGDSIFWSTYEELFQINCDKHQNVLIVKYKPDIELTDLMGQMDEQTRKITRQIGRLESEYNEEKKTADQERQNNQEYRKQMERQAQESAKQLAKLESESKANEMKYNEEKKTADQERQNNQDYRKQMERQAQNAAEQIDKLQRESEELMVRLEESKKNSEKREQAHRAQLDNLKMLLRLQGK